MTKYTIWWLVNLSKSKHSLSIPLYFRNKVKQTPINVITKSSSSAVSYRSRNINKKCARTTKLYENPQDMKIITSQLLSKLCRLRPLPDLKTGAPYYIVRVCAHWQESTVATLVTSRRCQSCSSYQTTTTIKMLNLTRTAWRIVK